MHRYNPVRYSRAKLRGSISPDLSPVVHEDRHQRGAPITTLRIGLGEDTHRLAPGGPLRLGGIDIPHDQHLLGHSDADVLLHAVTDALLGAACLPDIGQLFPNTDPANKDRDSAEMLRSACDNVESAGWKIVNLDCVVLAQEPRLGPYKESLRTRLAEILSLGVGQVNVKGKTGEGVGPIGEKQIIQARCVVLLEKRT